MSETSGTLFETGLERYKAGEAPNILIPVFKDLCDRSPKSAAALTCLAWLYLLDDKPNQAFKAAQKAVKLQPQDPQARINLVVAMLETSQTGVRQHIDLVKQLIVMDAELRTEIKQSIEDGLSRKPEWQSLERVQSWLFDFSP